MVRLHRRPSWINLAVHCFCVIFVCFPKNLLSFMVIHTSNFLKHFSMKKKLHCERIKSKTRLTNVNDKFANVFSILLLILRRVSQDLFCGI